MSRLDPMYRKLYIRKKPIVQRSDKEIYDEAMDEILTYYNEHGKDGFLSERMTKEEIPNYVERLVKTKKRFDAYEMVMESAIIDRAKEAEQMAEIKATEGFHKWVTKDDIQEIRIGEI